MLKLYSASMWSLQKDEQLMFLQEYNWLKIFPQKDQRSEKSWQKDLKILYPNISAEILVLKLYSASMWTLQKDKQLMLWQEYIWQKISAERYEITKLSGERF